MPDQLTDIAGLEAWTNYLKGIVAYSGNQDIISDFVSGQDVINMTSMYGPPLVFLPGGKLKAGSPGVCVVELDSDTFRVLVDTTGTAAANLSFLVEGLAPVADDFLL